jgi:N-acetylmuramoyl-L-alanine amidase
MKFNLLLFAAWLLASGLSPARAVVINGQNYVSITDWAGGNGMKSVWLKRNDILQTAGARDKLVFDVNSHYAEINGVQVALSFPVANQKGVAMVAQFDLDKTIRPLLYSGRYVKQRTIKTICLDPGHGGKDPGNRYGWHSEKTYTLLLANELAAQLKAAGFKVIFTRTKDTFVDLPVRPDIANRQHADLFVSLHFNAIESGRTTVSGAETYCITPVGASSSNAEGKGANYGATTANILEKNSLLLAYHVQASLVKNLGANDRGVRRARYAVLRDAEMPAILIESGYMTHPTEGKKIFTSAYRRQIATAIVKGIQAYQKETAPDMPPATETKKVSKTPPVKKTPTPRSRR